MPIETFPTILPSVVNGHSPFHENVIINSITRVIGGGNITAAALAVQLPHMTTNFQKPFAPDPTLHSETSLISISPVSVREKVNTDGAGTQNCSLYNRAIQAKLMIETERLATSQLIPNVFFPHQYYGDLAPQIDFETGDTPITIDDYTPPTLTLNETALLTYNPDDIISLGSVATVIGKVYESAFHFDLRYATANTQVIDAFFRGKNVFNNVIQFHSTAQGAEYDVYPPSINVDSAFYSNTTIYQNARWIIKNGDGDHKDWTYYHSDTPNADEYVTFDEDHWLIYDFGVDDQQIIGRIKLDFGFRDAHRHNHIEVYGSNDPNIFANNPPDVHPEFGPGTTIDSETPNQTWTYICDLTNTVSEGTFIYDGIIDQELTNTTTNGAQFGGTNNVLYRWYMLRFKSDGFEDNQLHVQRVRFFKKDISNVSEVKMSDFYGLFLLNVVKQAPQFGVNLPTYLSGYRIDTSTSGEIRLGSPFS